MNQTKLKERVNKRLNSYREQIKDVKISLKTKIKINSKSFRTKEGIIKAITKIDSTSNPIIYIISIKNIKEREKLIEIYKTFYNKNKERNSTEKLCVSRFNGTNSEVFYVGSKMKNLKYRFKQHFGDGYFKTYSLQLNKWDTLLDYNLEIEIFEIIPSIGKQYKRDFIELIEQELWEETLPVFGKKSGL